MSSTGTCRYYSGELHGMARLLCSLLNSCVRASAGCEKGQPRAVGTDLTLGLTRTSLFGPNGASWSEDPGIWEANRLTSEIFRFPVFPTQL